MATLLDLYHLMNSDGDLWKKVEAAALKAATAIKYEAENTTNHAARMVWAEGVFDDPKAWTVANKFKVLENATLASAGHSSTDNDVEFVVSSIAPAAA
jgi:hypothetical protein